MNIINHSLAKVMNVGTMSQCPSRDPNCNVVSYLYNYNYYRHQNIIRYIQ